MSDKITSYLQLFGIQGECTDPRFLTYIPILNWFFDGGKDSNTTRGGASKTSLREVVFMSYLENSSYKLRNIGLVGAGAGSLILRLLAHFRCDTGTFAGCLETTKASAT